ncbi:MAG: GldG family protein [bacterium]
MNVENTEQEVSRHRSWGHRKRFATGFNVLTSLILAITATILLNYLAAEHFRYRRDVSRKQFYSLSERTKHILTTVKGTITAHVVFSVSKKQKETVQDIIRLLEEYRQYAGRNGSLRLIIKQVDPDRDLATIEALKQKFDLRTADVVLFESGGHSRCIAERNIIKRETRWATPGTSLQSVKTAFCGEREFSSAILSLMENRKPVVCFVKGHGERDIEDFNKGSGYTDITRALHFENIETRSVRLTDPAGIPADCDLLIVAGPRNTMHRSEVAAISAYLKAGRSLLLLLDSGQVSGLEPLMTEWAVGLPDEVVIDRTSGLNAIIGTGEEIYIHLFGIHPITADLTDMSMILPRPVLPLETASPAANGRDDKKRLTILASCSENGWADTANSTTPTYDPAIDRKGPVSVALAVERGPSGGINIEVKPTRIAVVGDSGFVANGQSAGANVDFFINSVNWLLQRDTLVAVGPKPYDQTALLINDSQLWWIFMLVVIAIPLAVALLGIVVWLRRIW